MQGTVFGLHKIAELGRHGYWLSPGTLYPVLHGMEKRGLLRSIKPEVSNGRRVYRPTAAGRKALRIVKRRVGELFRELFEDASGSTQTKRRYREAIR